MLQAKGITMLLYASVASQLRSRDKHFIEFAITQMSRKQICHFFYGIIFIVVCTVCRGLMSFNVIKMNICLQCQMFDLCAFSVF